MPVSHLNMSITSRITDHHHRRRRRAQIASNMHILAIKRNLNNGSQLQAAAFPLSGQFTYIHTIYIYIYYTLRSLLLFLLSLAAAILYASSSGNVA